MKYNIIRQDIKSGDLLAWRKTGIWSSLIRGWTKSEYSHVGIAWKFQDRLFVLQDQERIGISLVALSENLPCDYISTNAIWGDEVEKFALSHLGQKYSYFNAFLASINVKPIGKKRICSEYASEVLNLAGVVEDVNLTLTPAKLVEHLLDLGCILQKVNVND